MARIDLYRNVHKGQRARLFDLGVELGRVDLDDDAAVGALATRLRETIAELRQHATTEEQFIHPLLRARAPGTAMALESEHHGIDTTFEEVAGKLRRFERFEPDRAGIGAELYRAWCRMVSAYLAHLDAEESVAMQALWDTCTDDEIFAVIRAFIASRTAADQMHDLRSQVPALSPHERAMLITSVLKNGAITAEPMWASLAGILPSQELSRLRADVGIGVG